MNPEKYSAAQAAWARVEAWLAASRPGKRLPKGADNAEVARAEAVLGLKLPESMRDVYRYHNGSGGISLCNLGYLMPLVPAEGENAAYDTVIDAWLAMRDAFNEGTFADCTVSEPIVAIKKDYWNLRWIPLTCDKQGNYACVDMDPPEDGNVGQVIEFERGLGPGRVLGQDAEDWLFNVVIDLEEGEYVPEDLY